jgi:hypothetical protein
MVGTRLGRARGRHVRVADRLDLLEPVPFREVVEPREELVEQVDDLARGRSWVQDVEPTMSAKTIDVSGYDSAMRCSPRRKGRAIDVGIAFVKSSSARASAANRRRSV